MYVKHPCFQCGLGENKTVKIVGNFQGFQANVSWTYFVYWTTDIANYFAIKFYVSSVDYLHDGIPQALYFVDVQNATMLLRFLFALQLW